MSRAVLILRRVVERAERHYFSTGKPLLYGRRRKSEWALVAIPGASGRFLVMLEPESPAGRLILLAAFMGSHKEEDILERLAKGAVAALAEVADRFQCDGREVGRWEVVLDSVCVRGPVALSCLSWVLREQRIGFYLTLSEAQPD